MYSWYYTAPVFTRLPSFSTLMLVEVKLILKVKSEFVQL